MSKYKHFSKVEGLELSILLKKGYSRRAISTALGKGHSSVVRELKRNKVHGRYDPKKAQHKAYVRRKESKYVGMKVREHPEIEQYVWEKMQPPFCWTPGQIAGRIRRERGIIMSYNAIYKYVYRCPFGYRLSKHLEYKRSSRKKRKSKKQVRELIPNRVWIDTRPDEINQRREFGHFEGDTMGRPRHASLETLAIIRERLSRKLFAVKVPRLKYAMEGFKKLLSPYQGMLGSVTFDNGVENVRHEEPGASTYFCHPYSSWEKGSVEQGIGLIREYIPKKADLKDYSDNNISAILWKINNAPMKCLEWRTADEVFEEQLTMKSLQLTYPQWCT